MLAVFYKGLYSCLSTKSVDADFLNFSSPFFPRISENLFKNIKESYGKEVVQSVMEQGQEQVDDVLFLINSMLPDLARCLAKQRRDYGLDEELFPVEFPIMDQAENVDQTPVNNMDMKRLIGETDYRLQKVKKLGAASRGIILGSTQHLS